jgi:hypothetical protein
MVVILRRHRLLGVFLSRLINRDYVSIPRGPGRRGRVRRDHLVSGPCLTTRWTGRAPGSSPSRRSSSGFYCTLIWSAWLAGEADAYFAWGRRSTEAAVALFSGQYRALQSRADRARGLLLGVDDARRARRPAAAVVTAFAGP